MIRAIIFSCLIAIAFAVNEYTCDYQEKMYEKSDRLMDDCNNCFCGEDYIVGSTKMWCGRHPVSDYSKMEADKYICEHTGKLYQKGDSFVEDCSQGDCKSNAMVERTKMRYRRHPTQECLNMKVDKDSCEHERKLYTKGDKFMDDCNHCFCAGNDIVGCTKMRCRHHPIPDYSKMGGTVVDSETCNFQGKKYKKGEKVFQCLLLWCADQKMKILYSAMYCGLSCYEEVCAASSQCNAGGSLTAKIYVIKTCELHGKIYSFGDHFKNDCNHCFCGWNGNIACTEITCIYKQQQLTKQQPCTLDGKTYKFADRFMKDCNRCFCGINGNIGCTEMLCIHPSNNPYLEIEACNVDGKVYKKGDNFSIDGGCNTCFCGGNDIVACTRMFCLREKEFTCKYSIE